MLSAGDGSVAASSPSLDASATLGAGAGSPGPEKASCIGGDPMSEESMETQRRAHELVSLVETEIEAPER
ncbi:MAG TPA: hypothetical protein VGX16_02575, partial [Solirubrobacteraceae bacterium]|nr:hypothetical protein [Solirubrobacteraceae bacterium]